MDTWILDLVTHGVCAFCGFVVGYILSDSLLRRELERALPEISGRLQAMIEDAEKEERRDD